MTVYDEIADMFMQSLAAQVAGVSRTDLIKHLRATWPTEDEARKGWEQVKARADATVKAFEREAAARGQTIIGIAYPVKK